MSDIFVKRNKVIKREYLNQLKIILEKFKFLNKSRRLNKICSIFSISKKFQIKIGLGIKKLTITQIKWALQPSQLPIQKYQITGPLGHNQ
jgi:hypothetical protein